MDVLSLLEELQQLVDDSSSMPFSKKVMVDKERLTELITEIKNKTPDELKQAKWVKEERQRILQDAQKEANDIIKEAENKIIYMIDDHEITKKAIEQRTEILDAAEKYKKDMINATREHADNILENLETLLKENLDMVRRNRKELK
ncbi:MAG: ATPase [Clostridia bacterium]|nr:ATPase [Clostridia bacterium]